jgi:hypothetical protein
MVFSLSVRDGSKGIEVSSVGYRTKGFSVHLDKDSTYIIQLVPEENQLAEVTVTGNRRKSIKDLTPGLTQFSPKEIEKSLYYLEKRIFSRPFSYFQE